MESKRGNIFVIGLVILLLISISVGGYLFWQNQQLSSQTQPTIQRQIAQPTPVIPTWTIVKNGNLATFTDTTVGYSFTYQSDSLIIFCEPDTNGNYNLELAINKNALGDYLYSSGCGHSGRLPIEIVYNTPKNSSWFNGSGPGDGYILVSSKNVIVDGVNTTSKTYSYSPPGGQGIPDWYSRVDFSKGNKKFVIILGDENYQQAFDQVLSSFKITN